MSGSPKKKAKKEIDKQIKKQQENIRNEHSQLVLAYKDGLLTEKEYRTSLMEMDYGEIHNLWRTQYLRCANPKDITQEQLTETAKRAFGNIAVMARILGLERHEVVRLIKEFPYLKRVIAEERENIIDLAECRLFEATNRCEEWAVKMVLNCLGKNRGWTKEISPTENKGRILDALNKLTGGMDEDELGEYDKDNNL